MAVCRRCGTATRGAECLRCGGELYVPRMGVLDWVATTAPLVVSVACVILSVWLAITEMPGD